MVWLLCGWIEFGGCVILFALGVSCKWVLWWLFLFIELRVWMWLVWAVCCYVIDILVLVLLHVVGFGCVFLWVGWF